MFKIVSLFLVFVIGRVTQGLVFQTGACDLEPRYLNRFTNEIVNLTTINVPHGCLKGVFWWDYPKGHVIVHFPNRWRFVMQICFRDDNCGSVFTINDVTSGVNYTLGHVESGSNSTVCTDPSESTDIVIRVDAPDHVMHVGSMSYSFVVAGKPF